MERRLAVFDIDGTLFRSSLVVELTEELIARGTFPEHVRDEYLGEREAWLDRRGSYDAYIRAVVTAFQRYLQGVHYSEFADAADAVVEQQQCRVYRYTRDYIAQLRSEGAYLVAVSHSPKRILDRFAEAFGFDKVYGTMYELGPEDRFTGGQMEQQHISNKANIVRRVTEKEQLSLGGSVGVGDTDVDVPFLELVDTAICFNPNQALLKHARRCGWSVVVERKDVVYDMQ